MPQLCVQLPMHALFYEVVGTIVIMGLLGDLIQMNVGQIFQTPNVPTADLSGQTIIITGANSGLGFEAARHLSVTCSTLTYMEHH